MNVRDTMPATLAEQAISDNEMRKVVTASVMRTIIEYYDFTRYTTLVFNKIFFPGETPLIGSLAVFATYFVGYCARLLGGVLFGHFCDRVGRKITLMMMTLMIMDIDTLLIGLIPPYTQIGVWRLGARWHWWCCAVCRASG